ncbi:hypothetical protein NLO88_02125 [Pseudomonas syringae]|nr:hypothetical protein [Pseudomonas syringae]
MNLVAHIAGKPSSHRVICWLRDSIVRSTPSLTNFASAGARFHLWGAGLARDADAAVLQLN